MALIVEDGSGKSDADSYAAVATADTYLANFGNPSDWSGATDAVKEMALRIATRYIDLVYGNRFKGVKGSSSQSLVWPRLSATDESGYVLASTIIPDKLQFAVAEVGVRYIQGDDILADIDEPGAIAQESIKAGPVALTTKYVGGTNQKPRFSVVDGLLEPYLQSGNEMVRS